MLYIRTLFVLLAILSMAVYSNSVQAQVLTTKLQVTVRDDAGNLVEGATVRLFASEADYTKEENQIGKTLKTNTKGQASFDALEPKEYYIIVEKEDMDNSDGGSKVEAIKPNRINKITVIIS